MTLRQRSATATDCALLRAIYASTRADELALTGWDLGTQQRFVEQQFEAQRTHYAACWPHADHHVIEVEAKDGYEPAGRLWVDRGPDAIRVLDIALLPAWRGKGIGAVLLQGLIDEAMSNNRTLHVSVESGNPARRLYDRLGFQPTGQPEGLHQRLVWQPVKTPAMETCDEQA